MDADAAVVAGASVPLAGLAERLLDDDLALAILTDEELAAIDQPLHPEGPVGWYGTLDPHDREVARGAALRSLVARGLLRPGVDQPDHLEVHPSLELLRTARRDALAVTIVDRDLGGERDRALLHLVAPGIVLEELLDHDGLHACTLRSPARAVAAMVARCDPDDVAGDAAGEPLGGEDADAAVHELADDLLHRASVRTELVTLRRTDRDARTADVVQAASTVVVVDGTVWAIATRPGPDGGAGPTVVVRLSAAELAATLAGVLDPLVLPEGA